MYDIPAAASGDAGLEGFSVAVDDRRAGRIAAVNRAPEGLVLVVDRGDEYRVVAAASVAAIETRSRTVRLTDEGERALDVSPPVEARVQRIDSPALVRYIPRGLDRLVVEGEAPPREPGSRRRAVGVVLTYVGAVVLFVTVPVVATVGSGALRWLWILVPAIAFVAGGVIVWRAIGSGEGRRLTAREKAGDVVTFLLGISPQTRRRG